MEDYCSSRRRNVVSNIVVSDIVAIRELNGIGCGP